MPAVEARVDVPDVVDEVAGLARDAVGAVRQDALVGQQHGVHRDQRPAVERGIPGSDHVVRTDDGTGEQSKRGAGEGTCRAARTNWHLGTPASLRTAGPRCPGVAPQPALCAAMHVPARQIDQGFRHFRCIERRHRRRPQATGNNRDTALSGRLRLRNRLQPRERQEQQQRPEKPAAERAAAVLMRVRVAAAAVAGRVDARVACLVFERDAR